MCATEREREKVCKRGCSGLRISTVQGSDIRVQWTRDQGLVEHLVHGLRNQVLVDVDQHLVLGAIRTAEHGLDGRLGHAASDHRGPLREGPPQHLLAREHLRLHLMKVLRLRVWGVGLRVSGVGLRVWGVGCTVEGVGCEG